MRLVLAGRVQGLGVRPAVLRLAKEMRLTGVVRNTSRGLEIEVEGPRSRLLRLSRRLHHDLPAGVRIEHLDSESIEPLGRTDFTIERQAAGGPMTARVPPDLAACPDCLEEVSDDRRRRYRYPFTSCTACGPRYTIIRSMPYERSDTTMSGFEFCAPCRFEYERFGDRRFHAQTNACQDCGPRVWCVERGGRTVGWGEDAIRAVARGLQSGDIAAIRGLGGYQLLADATDGGAAGRLRDRKRRPAKPLAVMVESLEEADQWALLDDAEREALAGADNPIVLVRARSDTALASSIHPRLDTVGLMLPTTPLHAMLIRDVKRPLICTSGNRDGDPLEYEIDRAAESLAGVCDLWLHHDRPIARPIDDSVVRVIAGRTVAIRLARGLAPLPLGIPSRRPMLALGGYLKSAAAWCNGAQAVLGPHVGDHEGLAARRRFLDQCEDWKNLYQFEPERLVHDMHPAYFTSQWASAQKIPRFEVQHHHAHVVAAMLEHGWLDRTVLGVAWDGTGYGADGTIWGGEMLLASARSFQRLASLRPFRLPGGEAAVSEPWRVALSMAADVVGVSGLHRLACWRLDRTKRSAVERVLHHPQFSPVATSAGRLFDAASAIILGIDRVDFDGQAAMMLEAAADRDAPGRYEFPVQEGEILELDWRPLLASLLSEREEGVDPGAMAMRLHRGVAAGIVGVCLRHPDLPLVFSGGVFQNRLLTELVLEMLPPHRRLVGPPGLIPPNDGGLAAGQLAIACANLGEI